jgi:hypothetical protein
MFKKERRKWNFLGEMMGGKIIYTGGGSSPRAKRGAVAAYL